MASYQDYLLHLADNAVILGQRNAEWCGHGPILEEDLALANNSLDLIGQARLLYQHVAAVRKDGKSSEDLLAYFRDVPDFKNYTLLELPHWERRPMRNSPRLHPSRSRKCNTTCVMPMTGYCAWEMARTNLTAACRRPSITSCPLRRNSGHPAPWKPPPSKPAWVRMRVRSRQSGMPWSMTRCRLPH